MTSMPLDSCETTIHVFDVLDSFHADMFAKMFVQTNSAIGKENVQALWVWRFKPPFGSLQLAYQTGTSEQGQISEQGDTFIGKRAFICRAVPIGRLATVGIRSECPLFSKADAFTPAKL